MIQQRTNGKTARPMNEQRSIAWAKDFIAQHKDALVLDTETTGLDDDAEIVEIAVVDLAGNVLVNSLVQCVGDIGNSAQAVHGINKAMLKTAPTFPELWKGLAPLMSQDILIYNAAFDTKLLRQTAARHGIVVPTALRAHCLMEQYSEFVGVKGYYGGYKWQRLDSACHQFSIVNPGAHRALDDAEAARKVLLALANEA